MSSMQSIALPKKPVRDSNIELLRILTMFGVVILHYNNASMGGGFAYVAGGSINQMILKGLESLFICAVNLFILISGYFSCNSKRAEPVKAFSLLLQVVVFGAIEYAVALASGQAYSTIALLKALLPSNYFVWLYIATYLLSPFINTLLSKLNRRQCGQFVLLCFLLFSAWPATMDLVQCFIPVDTTSMNTLGLFGSNAGYTITNFLLMYVIGAWLRISDFKVKKRYSLLVLILCTGLITLLSMKDEAYAWSYHTPLVIIEAAAAFTLFRQISFRSKVINFMAKGAFSCFLLHMLFIPYYNIEQAVGRSPLQLVGHVFFCAVSIYCFCFAVYLIYDLLAKPVVSLVDKLFRKTHLVIDLNKE